MNQCDGCRRGLPIERGLHRLPSGLPDMACTADLYAAFDALLGLEACPAAPPEPEMCECGMLPAPCGCVTIKLPPRAS